MNKRSLQPTMTGINKEEKRERTMGKYALFKEMLTEILFQIKIKSEKQTIQPLFA